MRLESIKLAGFKSFVDPVTLTFPSNLTGIVGPNGCGKSNLIDAICWVISKSSAKQLRGESFSDIIFSGSSTRHSIGRASVELLFDNSDGSLAGEYASYSQIAVRREIVRHEQQSTYFLNGARCRRQDIVDIFLGTGLGSQSYAIVRQGMVTKLVEAKPEELRSYIEEAAGISKYKERRRETELSIQHTQENLNRLSDLREELTKQLQHLQRQATVAERYKKLKKEASLLKAQIQALRYQQLQQTLTGQADTLQSHEAQLTAACETQTALDDKLAHQREHHAQVSAHNNTVQASYYELGNAVVKLEQMTQNQQSQHHQWENEQKQLTQAITNNQQQLQNSDEQQKNLNDQIIALTSQIQQANLTAEKSQAALKQAETALQTWQHQWDVLNQETARVTQKIQINKTHIQHLEQRQQTLQQTMLRLEKIYEEQINELASTNHHFDEELADLKTKQEESQCRIKSIDEEITKQRRFLSQTAQALDSTKSRLQTLYGQQASLEALQQVALGQTKKNNEWLQSFVQRPRLAQVLQVEPGWEQAVETVLDRYLQSICVDSLSSLDDLLPQLPKNRASFIAKSTDTDDPSIKPAHDTLAGKLNSSWSIAHLLFGVYADENLQEAFKRLPTLKPHESVVTRDGIWLSHGCIYTSQDNQQAGVIQRERELNRLKQALQATQQQVADEQAAMTQAQEALNALEKKQKQEQQQLHMFVVAESKLQAQRDVQKARLHQINRRIEQITLESQEHKKQFQLLEKQLEETQAALKISEQDLPGLTQQRDNLLQTKDHLKLALDTSRQQAHSDQTQAHRDAMQLQASQLQFEAAQQTRQHLSAQQEKLKQRQQTLQSSLASSTTLLRESLEQLQCKQQEQQQATEQLTLSSQHFKQAEEQLKQLEQERQLAEKNLSTLRDTLEQMRLQHQTQQARADALKEQLLEEGYDITDLINALPTEANTAAWEEKFAKMTQSIERLGAINLAAIDEYQTLLERHNYLMAQHDDLTTALDTLNAAMHQMDQASRMDFQETFHKINQNFKTLFPHLFAGGQAELVLNAEDWLTAGVTITAQPGGKRHSNIHSLSGGEKTLTAIALIFSFFQLNPAPFCLLDEIDAALDDANVARFCMLLREIAQKTQFIFISHNKLALEMAEHLIGVTMPEAGISRLATVDIEATITRAEV